MKTISAVVRILISIFRFAQNGATISGRVFDDATDQPLSFITITVTMNLKLLTASFPTKMDDL
jgi:hypothetical protein